MITSWYSKKSFKASTSICYLLTCGGVRCLSGDGNLDMAEVVSMIEKENADLQEASQFTEQIVRTLDKDGDGRVSK